ncbi:MAG: DUF4159 domain-containing protein, partial [Pirellulaceae bacterium]|nr:DUF4159 domain-containing protein [Pirellulaceae bacterium]
MSNVLVRIPFLALTLAATTITAQSVTDQEVTTAIGRMKRHFYRIQDRQSGHWEASYRNSHYGGETALVVLALLLSGESAQSPPLAKAIGWLAKAQLNSTYAVALRAMVWSHLPDSYHERLVVDAKWLLEAAASHGRHLFDYRSHKTSRFDHSVTQFATLGLWGAAKRGVRIPAVFWSRLQTHFLDSQTLDGGWGYNDTGAAYGSMTAAGLTVLLVCRQQLNPNSTDVPERLNRSIDDALKWLDHRFDGAKNPASGRWPYYYLASIERVALAGGIRQLNGQDWYRVGARHILDQHFIDESSPAFGSVTSSPWQTAFALMFLARGQYPVWISKLAVPELRWNRRPNDIHQLTEYLSNVSERELNWQVVTVDSPAQNWINAPLLYLTSSESVALTESQQQHVKRYLELGGTLVASPIKGSSKFKVSIRRLVRAMHPRFRMRPLGADHPLFRSVHRLKAGTGGPVFGLSNGVRELVLLADRDWG